MEEKQKFTGKAIHTFGDGSEYSGEFVNGKQEGYGIMTFANRDKYDGDWMNGLMDGQGKYYFYDNEKKTYNASYKGQFVKGCREGVGRMEYNNRDVYEGQWQNNFRTGNGVCWYANGDCYHGLWRFDKKLRGVFHKENGEKYDGEFVDGRIEGYGKYYWLDGKWYEGTFKDGKLHNGIVISPDGKISEYVNGIQM